VFVLLNAVYMDPVTQYIIVIILYYTHNSMFGKAAVNIVIYLLNWFRICCGTV